MKTDIITIINLIQTLGIQQRGVLTTRDLEILFKTSNRQLLKNRILPFLEKEVLIRFSRGYYIAPKILPKIEILAALSQRIRPNSIISLGTILSKNRIIGTDPANTIYAVKIGTTRRYENDKFGTIIHFGFGKISDRSMYDFGYTLENGIRYADPERALLDTLYFYQRGNKFFFNIYEDIDVSTINKTKYFKYLKKYSNSRFQAFARSFIDEK